MLAAAGAGGTRPPPPPPPPPQHTHTTTTHQTPPSRCSPARRPAAPAAPAAPRPQLRWARTPALPQTRQRAVRRTRARGSTLAAGCAAWPGCWPWRPPRLVCVCVCVCARARASCVCVSCVQQLAVRWYGARVGCCVPPWWPAPPAWRPNTLPPPSQHHTHTQRATHLAQTAAPSQPSQQSRRAVRV
jgi:hypothetical protein